jgi:hypothetical protein
MRKKFPGRTTLHNGELSDEDRDTDIPIIAAAIRAAVAEAIRFHARTRQSPA